MAFKKGNRFGIKNSPFIKGHKINVGRKHSEETREKYSLAKLGDKNPSKRPEVRKKISESGRGLHIGEKNGNWKHGLFIKKCLTCNQDFKTYSNKFCSQICYHNSIIGTKHPEKQKINMKITWNKPEYKKLAKERRAKQIFPLKDSIPEKVIQNFLTILHKEYFTHKYMNIEHAYQCDILIPKQKGIEQDTIIECDGCYWHGCNICNKNFNSWQEESINRDIQRTKELQEKGFKVIRLWEIDINSMNLNDFKEKLND